MKAAIRKITVWIEETHREAGQSIVPPTRKAVAVAVIANPFAGRYEPDLSALIEIGAELGALLGSRCVEALGIEPHQAQSYGKGAMVGEAGELEHAAAILHPKLGAPLRAAVQKGAALVPSSKKMGGPGQGLDVPLGHKDAAYVRSTALSMNAGEIFAVVDGGVTVDGPTRAGLDGRCHERIGIDAATDASWQTNSSVTSSTPGVARPVPGLRGLVITEWCDAAGAGNFIFEYIELTNLE